MNKDKLEGISDALEQVYDTIQQAALNNITEQLSKNTSDNNAKEWKKKQLSQTNELKKRLNKTIFSYKPLVQETMDKAIKMAFKVSLEDDNLKEDKDHENKEIETLSKQMKKQNDKDLEMLTKLSVFAFKKDVLNAYSNFQRSGENLMASIEKTIDTLKNPANTPKVAYSNGRKVSWKSYMEMNVRTTLSQKATEYQLSVGKYNGVVFYTTQILQDCAEDHYDYQGKIYYDREAISRLKDEQKRIKVLDYISSHECYDIKECTEGKPYMTSRPNCRHRYRALITEDVLNAESVVSILKKEHLIEGRAERQNYEFLQTQRANERRIRAYKQRLDEQSILLSKASDLNSRAILERKIDISKQLVRKWQKQNVMLTKQHGFLERDYRRESYSKVVQDVGYRYNKKK